MSEATQVVERLLIIDDVVDIAELIGELGRQVGFKVTVTTDIDAFSASHPTSSHWI